MLSMITEGWLFKKNPEMEKYLVLAAEAYIRAQVEREVAESRGYQTFTKSEIELYIKQNIDEIYEQLRKRINDPEIRNYYSGLYPKDFERQLRAERWTSTEIKYWLKFLDYMKKAVKAYEDKSKWK